MKWEDFKGEPYTTLNWKWADTNIECPECGSKIKKDVSVVLACFPPKYHYKCFVCGWKGYK